MPVPGEEDALGARLASVVHWLSAGGAPEGTAEHLGGARLIALLKPDCRLRPIAVGEVLRRLTAKCVCSAVRPAAREYLWRLQSGVTVSMGGGNCCSHCSPLDA